ncbi:prepilin-type N-terminal cleavage/methylation domain-containing protein [Pontibacillus yanchengensis]|uniref:Tfp assembly type protein n=1 Tax=Pontibacillus yanchengensis Y32 TaxID=1385514 RepID=A0A0A2TIJ0_9BACI|nr:prepilin-type N-terminal cleavage/methylation domain-containing protein [Pontibacillus yanchengensis]KGP73881.1 hypothetical protein N782_21235 [Pontibacillus yanchengensis Y32]
MFNNFRKRLSNEKGFTLVELLAVIVILGIIAAIAVPAIGNIIGDTKKEAHVSNAQSMIEAARLAHTTDDPDLSSPYTLSELVEQGYLDSMPGHPDSGSYDGETSTVTVTENTSSGGITYSVSLNDGEGEVASGEKGEVSAQ